MKILKILKFGPILILTISCADYDRENFRMEVGKEYALKEWPDSAYIDTLDRYFMNEPVKQQRSQKVDITMNMNNNLISLPKKEQALSKLNVPKQTSKAPQIPRTSESFPDKFFNALNKLSENPNSREFGKRHRAQGGETLDDLLVRVYGSQVRKIPKFASESMIKQLNPGTDFSSLSEGEMILLPLVTSSP